MRHSVRYVTTIAASSTAAVASMTLGLLIGKYAVEQRRPNGFVAAVTIAMAGVVTLPAYIVKKPL